MTIHHMNSGGNTIQLKTVTVRLDILLDHPVPSSIAVMNLEAAVADGVGTKRERTQGMQFCLHGTHTHSDLLFVCYGSPA